MTDQPVQNCGKCGLCLSVCPVYKVLKQEQASPRARLQLIKAYEKKDLSASPLLKDLVSQCLMCGACKVFKDSVLGSGEFQQAKAASLISLLINMEDLDDNSIAKLQSHFSWFQDPEFVPAVWLADADGSLKQTIDLPEQSPRGFLAQLGRD